MGAGSGAIDCNANNSTNAAGSMMCSWDDERIKQTNQSFEWCHQSQANCESDLCNKGSNSEWVRFHHRGCAGGGYSPQVCDETWGSCSISVLVLLPFVQLEAFPHLVRSWTG
jgi:hypothetical protein